MPFELLLGGEVSCPPLPGLLAPGYYPSFDDLQPIVRMSKVIEKKNLNLYYCHLAINNFISMR